MRAVCLLLATMTLSAQSLEYPKTATVDHVDVYHGAEVRDPYRWLERDVRESEEVREWVKAQNKVTFSYLEKIPQRDQIRDRLTKIWNYERYEGAFIAGDRYFFLKNDGLQNQPVLMVANSPEGEQRLLIDPNQWTKDGTAALSYYKASPTGRYLLYGISKAGSDWQTWRILDVDSGKDLDESLEWVKFSSASWTRDGRGFFYARYPEPAAGATFQSLNKNKKVYYHRLGTPQTADVLTYERPDQPDWGFSPEVSDDGSFLVLTVWVGTDDRYRILYRNLDEPYSSPVELIDNFEHLYGFLGNNGSTFFFLTNVDAPRRRVVAIDIHKPQREHWKEIVPQSEDTVETASLVGNVLVLNYLHHAQSRVQLYTLDGKPLRQVEFEGVVYASGFNGARSQIGTFYSVESFAVAPSLYYYDVIRGESKLIFRPKTLFQPEEFETKQVFYQSKDGTRVPMFLTYRKGLEPNGRTPTLLWGYGGFNISIVPEFRAARIAWLEMGGILAIPNLRGGGEYGEEWHKAGTKLKKQNVFDDYIAAAEYLIREKYTSRDKLVIQGRSNGGLLVGAALTQRPDLFAAALPAVGVMDMLRFHQFTAGRFWTDDYGSAENPQDFEALRTYSPYHNIKPGAKYPPTLVTTADTDDRVVPGHSFKFAARLQAAQAGDAPVLIRIETSAGHGAGKPTTKRIEEAADEWTFVVENLDMQLPEAWKAQ